LIIDQFNASGTLVPQGQQQIITWSGSSSTTAGLADDIRYWNSDLLNYTGWNLGTTTTAGVGTVTSNNSLIGRNGVTYLGISGWTIPPANWQ
ncbi:MAG TPA: hypothetical protein VEI97_17165, partial [bacterium]|nr:hypothetical protein [bacterium]